MIWILFDIVIRIILSLESIENFHWLAYISSTIHSIFVLSLCVFLQGLFANKHYKVIVSVLFSTLLTIILISNFFNFIYFKTYIGVTQLSFVLKDLSFLKDYIITYFDWRVYIIFFGLIALQFYIFQKDSGDNLKTKTKTKFGFLLISGLIISSNLAKINDSGKIIMPMSKIYNGLRLVNQYLNSNGLSIPSRNFALKPISHPLSSTNTVILFIHESWGGHSIFYSPDKINGMPKLKKFLEQRPQWINFENFFANSSATDVSMPSILSGLSPIRSKHDFHNYPILSNLAKNAGFETWYISSQKLSFANLRDYLSLSNFDYIAGQEDFKSPIVNDLGSDDIFVANQLAQKISATEKNKKLFILINTNALHAPFQQKSNYLNEKWISNDSLRKALQILDFSIAKVLTSLDQTGRLDDSFIMMTGDHGELAYNKRIHKEPRIVNFYDEILKVPALLIAPNSLEPQLQQNLQNNKYTNLQNLDIFPTFAHIFGYCSLNEMSFCNQYEGISLFGTSNKIRQIIALNTNEFRRSEYEGFAIIQEDKRLVFSNVNNKVGLYDMSSDKKQTKNIWNNLSESEQKEWIETISSQSRLFEIYSKYSN